MSKIKKGGNPLFWIPTTYFAMGLPFVVLNMSSTLMFNSFQISDAQIAFWTSLIMLPWTLKPLWSPFLEMVKTKKYFVVMTQLIIGITFGLVAFALHLPAFFAIAITLFFFIAFSGATHDIAADGQYMDALTKQQQAKYIGVQGAFYNLAKVVASGALVYLAGYLTARVGHVQAWMVVMMLCAIVMCLLGFYHMRAIPEIKSSERKSNSVSDVWRELTTVFGDFFTKKHILYYLLFIVLYRFAEGFVMKIVPLFLVAPVAEQGLGLSQQQVGLYYGTYGAIAFICGSLLAGYYVSRRGLKRCLFTLCCFFNLPFAIYLLFAIYQPTNGLLIAGGIMIEYFGYGFGFVGLTLFMMQQIAPGKHQMAHYAFTTGVMNLGVMLPGMFSGMISDAIGYRNYFIFVMVATIPAFLITYFVPFTYADEKHESDKS